MKTDSKSFVLASNAVIFDADGKVISESKLGSSVIGSAVFKNGKIVALYATNTADELTYNYAYVNSVYQDTDDDNNEIQRVNAYIQGAKNEKLFTSDDDTFAFSGTSGKGLYVLGLNDEDIVQSREGGALSINKSNAVTATAINTSTGKIELASKIDVADSDSNYFFDQNAGTIIRIKTDGKVEIVNRLNAIDEDVTKVECFKAITDYVSGSPVYSIDTVNFIIIWD